jgi:fido (protein-threonine AMPylation protein)
MHPGDCPAFDYKSVDGYDKVLRGRTERLLRDLRGGNLLARPMAIDSRPTHSELFNGLTPPKCEYFAGHYRGERFRCLAFYEVGVLGDPGVGAPAQNVGRLMDNLAGRINSLLDQLDTQHQKPEEEVSAVYRLRAAAAVAADVFERFLMIHPYADGNGHTARFVVWAVLARHGYYPVRWRIHPRPGHRDYTELIVQHRYGVRAPLQRAILESITDPLADDSS